MGTGKQQAITITGHSGLDDGEIDRMVKDADAHSEEDKKRRELIDTKNQADQMVYSLEKLMRENKDKIPEADAKNIQDEIEKVKKAIENDNIEEIKSAIETLSQASHKLSEMMYQQAAQEQQAQQGQGAQGTPDPGTQAGSQQPEADQEEEIIDAEVVEEEKKKD
jgi:molecular chaperone DnaK